MHAETRIVSGILVLPETCGPSQNGSISERRARSEVTIWHVEFYDRVLELSFVGELFDLKMNIPILFHTRTVISAQATRILDECSSSSRSLADEELPRHPMESR